jgi:hypothetical protein
MRARAAATRSCEATTSFVMPPAEAKAPRHGDLKVQEPPVHDAVDGTALSQSSSADAESDLISHISAAAPVKTAKSLGGRLAPTVADAQNGSSTSQTSWAKDSNARSSKEDAISVIQDSDHVCSADPIILRNTSVALSMGDPGRAARAEAGPGGGGEEAWSGSAESASAAPLQPLARSNPPFGASTVSSRRGGGYNGGLSRGGLVSRPLSIIAETDTPRKATARLASSATSSTSSPLAFRRSRVLTEGDEGESGGADDEEELRSPASLEAAAAARRRRASSVSGTGRRRGDTPMDDTPSDAIKSTPQGLGGAAATSVVHLSGDSWCEDEERIRAELDGLP